MANRIGLVGLGQMGMAICSRLASTFDVLAYDISTEQRTRAAENLGVELTDALRDLEGCDTVVLSLPTPRVSVEILEELGAGLDPGSVVVETSTVLPEDARAEQRLLNPERVRVIDAAVLSGVNQMADGQATLLVGGQSADIESRAAVLEIIGGAGYQIFGSLGNGMAAKVVNNSVAHAVMVVLVEAFAMAAAEGVELAEIAAMLERPDGGLVRPLTHRIMERVAHGRYEGGMPLDAARKDSLLALAMAQQAQLPIFATQSAHTVYDLASAAGLGREDYSSLAKLWEQWGDRSLHFEAKKSTS